MRVVKEAEERRNEILDVAERLFATKGFDNTSTNDILDEVGIARGTLYYHFKSKEDILDAMIERISKRLVAKAKAIAENKEIPVLQRMTMAIMALNLNNDLGREVMEQVHRTQNALLHQKMRENLLTGVNPVITGLVKEGIEQGICRTDYPAEVVEMTKRNGILPTPAMRANAADTKEHARNPIAVGEVSFFSLVFSGSFGESKLR